MNIGVKIFAIFTVFAVILYYVFMLIVEMFISKSVSTSNGLLNEITSDVYYMFLGYVAYWGLLIFISITGLLIGLKKRDRVMISTFKILTLALIALSVGIYLVDIL
jgi:hypothetical protein